MNDRDENGMTRWGIKLNDRDVNGMTPLLILTHSDCKMYAKNGIKLNAADINGRTEFMFACQKGHDHVVKLVDKYLTKLTTFWEWFCFSFMRLLSTNQFFATTP